MIRDLLIWLGFISDKKEIERNELISERLEIEHNVMKEEEKYKRGVDWVKHIVMFYDIIKERRLENISRRAYREGHTRFLTTNKPNAKTKKTS